MRRVTDFKSKPEPELRHRDAVTVTAIIKLQLDSTNPFNFQVAAQNVILTADDRDSPPDTQTKRFVHCQWHWQASDCELEALSLSCYYLVQV